MRALGQLQATDWKELTVRQQNLGIGLPVSGRLRTGTSIVAFASRLFTLHTRHTAVSGTGCHPLAACLVQ